MYKKIMVPLDGSKLAECALPHLETIALGCQPAEVIIVQAVEPIAIPYGVEMSKFASLEQVKEFETHHKAAAEKYQAGVIRQLKEKGIAATGAVIYGKAGDALTEYAEKNRIDLVIIATHGRSGLSRWTWGSVADRLLHSLRMPVLMIRAQ